MVAEDEGMCSGTLEKRYLSVEARSNEAKRGGEELISNLKLRADSEGEFIRKLASGRHRGRGGALETRRHLGRPVLGRRTISMAAPNGQRDRYVSAFAPIFVLYDDAYGGGMARLRLKGGRGGGTHRNGGWHTDFRRN